MCENHAPFATFYGYKLGRRISKLIKVSSPSLISCHSMLNVRIPNSFKIPFKSFQLRWFCVMAIQFIPVMSTQSAVFHISLSHPCSPLPAPSAMYKWFKWMYKCFQITAYPFFYRFVTVAKKLSRLQARRNISEEAITNQI